MARISEEDVIAKSDIVLTNSRCLSIPWHEQWSWGAGTVF